jgi:hypothetical protein
MIKKLLLTLATVVALVGAAPSAAQADTANEIYLGCEHTLPSIGSAQYYATFEGITMEVYLTVGWQTIAGSWSNCEDINVSPDTNQAPWNWTPLMARSWICNGSYGGCYYSAWRDCSLGCTAAENIPNGYHYQVHFASRLSVGTWIHEYD